MLAVLPFLLMDAYNLDVTPEWYSDRVIGIDKGISLVMIENYRSGLIWQVVGEERSSSFHE